MLAKTATADAAQFAGITIQQVCLQLVVRAPADAGVTAYWVSRFWTRNKV